MIIMAIPRVQQELEIVKARNVELTNKLREAIQSAQRQSWFFAGNEAQEYDLESLTAIARDWHEEWEIELKELNCAMNQGDVQIQVGNDDLNNIGLQTRSPIEILQAIPVIGNAHDDADIFILADEILRSNEETFEDKIAALKVMDSATGEPGDYTQAAIDEYLESIN